MTVSHPIFSRFYDRLSRAPERQGADEHRREMLAGLTGRVIEVGAGNLRAVATAAATTARVPVRLVNGVAEELPYGDAEFDAGVFSLVLCFAGGGDRQGDRAGPTMSGSAMRGSRVARATPGKGSGRTNGFERTLRKGGAPNGGQGPGVRDDRGGR